ncbi:MAG: hypothetical protein AAGJ46_07245 [Planctomycetota bacterium]
MKRLPRQRRISALLAAIYVIVGATGDSLHYLFESPSPAAAAEEQHADGFFHDHGDGNWHHHGHHQRPRAEFARQATRDVGKVERGAADAATRIDAPCRHDHSTVLLAIASAIELSLLQSSAATLESLAVRPIGRRERGAAAAVLTAALGPRGPPCWGSV